MSTDGLIEVLTTAEELKLLEVLKEELKADLDPCPKTPPYGHRKLLRFLRGCSLDVSAAATCMRKDIAWRRDNHIDGIRHNIVSRGLSLVSDFPFADIVLPRFNQTVMDASLRDIEGFPVGIERLAFDPDELFNALTLEDFLLFWTHCMEYKMIIINKIEEEAEEAVGVPMLCLGAIVRDLKGISLGFQAAKSFRMLKPIISLIADHYPETLGRCFIVNAPWTFTAIWYLIQGIIPLRTQLKVSVMGYDYQDKLSKFFPEEAVRLVNSAMPLENAKIDLTSSTGLYHYRGHFTRDHVKKMMKKQPDDDVDDDDVVKPSITITSSSASSSSTQRSSSGSNFYIGMIIGILLTAIIMSVIFGYSVNQLQTACLAKLMQANTSGDL